MSKVTWLRKIGNELLDLVYPPGLYCICCGKIIDDSRPYRLCNDCMKSMNWNTGRHCAKCGRPLADTDPGRLCFGCARREAEGDVASFDKGHACTGYDACAQSVIFALKYGGRADIGDTIGEILFDRMLSEYEADELAGMYDIVTAVPVHIDKLKKRGFNHAALIGQSFAKRAGLCFDANIIKRTRMTQPMKELGPVERIENIRGAFEIRDHKRPATEDARVLLIDDIVTTGATINEIARVLKEPWNDDAGLTRTGAARVDFLVFAAAGDMII